MSDQFNCNISQCNARLNDGAWVTRCLHVFCSEHGASVFHNTLDQANCPVCHEINVKPSDVSFCQANPSDMVLAGLRPEKILRIVDRSVKLWKRQLDADRRYNGEKLHDLTKQLADNTRNIKLTLHRKNVEHSEEIAALQSKCSRILVKLKEVQQELDIAMASARKFKAAHEALLVTSAHVGGPLSSRNYFDFSASPFHRAMPRDNGFFSEEDRFPDF